MLRLKESSLKWGLKHARNHGDTDVFPQPFEYDALEYSWSTAGPALAQMDILQWTTRPSRTLLAPKGRYGFRAFTQLDPLDFVVYAALVYELAADIEKRRVPLVRNVVFSYRTAPSRDGDLFDNEIGYRQFLEQCHVKASSRRVGVVATTDIADFYPRIYHHRLDNALRAASDKASHVTAVMRLLSGWNNTESFGIPVGSAPSRLLAELTIADVDEALLASGVDFVRFNDDYRIFARDESQAYRHLGILAEWLFKNHGLGLQQSKTAIIDAAEFKAMHLTAPADREVESLHARFEALVDEIGLAHEYEAIEYDQLTPSQQETVDKLNLAELCRTEIADSNPDVHVIRFCLRRLGQLGDDELVDDVFEHLEVLAPVFVDVVGYCKSLRHLSPRAKERLGKRLLALLDDTIVSELTYHRMWILSVFADSNEWNSEDRLLELYTTERDAAARREVVLAMGRARHRHWFQSQWRSLFEHTGWQRRAVLAAASCMPADARRHWYRTMEPQLDLLERAVARWATAHPFGT